ncbi:ribose-phosphate pyrophosphokinase [Thermogemmatispora aurantia]|jgi:ribose-phosphate pyrophosphokinase|uniref:ribose-phosphate diphosphokinase n=1 Tax=Thermogemmatispora aurantia TaxID=2045279 RepID=A0A5J4KHA5_9CHLR|nr:MULTISPECIES: ribose-phosphate pyrophosphokinase [Thermogemmatispora]GER85680.1 ribose-phosphate pyrophosphokinase [Thermogemmatispora aurantia]
MTESAAAARRPNRSGPPIDVDIYSGSATPELAQAVASCLGRPLGRRELHRFADGECHVQIQESVRGRDIYIVQSTCYPVNEHLMELLVMIDAFRRASAARVTAIIPYYGYARQEKKTTGREPITAKLVANLLSTAGADRVVSVDLHSPAIQGFFDIGMDHLTAIPLLGEYLRQHMDLSDAVVVTPDTGRVKVADVYANMLNIPLVVMHKRRGGNHAQDVEVRAIVGEVANKRPIIVDDIISTGGTIVTCTQALLEAGAKPDITVVATHAVLTPPAEERLCMPEITRVVTTDTIPLGNKTLGGKVVVISVASLLAETIERLHEGRSISALFRDWRESYPV